MKAATQEGRCVCTDQCGGNSSREHVYNLDEFMGKLSQMLADPDPHDVQYSPGEWDKVWLGPNSFVVLGKFWDDFYVTEEVVVYIHAFLAFATRRRPGERYLSIHSPDLLCRY